MYRLYRDSLCCVNCRNCDLILPGFSYREDGLLISRTNYIKHKDQIDQAFDICNNNALILSKLS